MPSNEQEHQEQLVRFQLFCTTKLEADKSLLTLSTAGLGLIITLLTGDKVASIFELVLFILGSVLFVVCIFAILSIFNRNADYIAKKDSDDKHLVHLDSIAKYAFRLGIAITALGAIVVSINNLTNNIKGKAIDEYKRNETQTEPLQHNKLDRGQLGWRERNSKASSEKLSTTKPIAAEGQKIMSDPKIEMVNTKPTEIKKSWEGANAILDTPKQEQTSESSSSESSTEQE